MTTGERLVDISTLTTGTAMEHFLNISETSYVDRNIAGSVTEEDLTGVLGEDLTGVLEEVILPGQLEEMAVAGEIKIEDEI